MSIEDKLAILEGIAAYSHTLDNGDDEGWVQLFTEDAVWESYTRGSEKPAIRYEGKDGIRRFAAWTGSRQADMHVVFLDGVYAARADGSRDSQRACTQWAHDYRGAHSGERPTSSTRAQPEGRARVWRRSASAARRVEAALRIPPSPQKPQRRSLTHPKVSWNTGRTRKPNSSWRRMDFRIAGLAATAAAHTSPSSPTLFRTTKHASEN